MKDRAEKSEKELRDKFTHMLTQISVFSNLKLDNGVQSSNSNGASSNGSSSSSVADLDEWMTRVTEGLKKKMDVYESLLGALKNQLQDKREKELMSVGGGAKSSSAKFMNEAAANGGGSDADKKNGTAGKEGESNGNGTELST